MIRGISLALLVMAAGAAVGCGGTPGNVATRDDLGALETRMNQKVDSEMVQLQRKLVEAKEALPEILAAKQRLANELEELQKLKAKVEKDMRETKELVRQARGDMLRILEAEEKLLVDRLATLREVIQTLRERQEKKDGGE